MTMENDLASALDGIADPLTGKGLLAANRLPPPVIRDGVATLVLAVDGLSGDAVRSEEHTSELQSLMRNSYAVFCLKKKQELATVQQRTQVIHATSTFQPQLYNNPITPNSQATSI